MPSVDVAMARSLRRGVVDGFVDLLSASLRPALERRDAITDAQGQISDVKTAFSSWDNCMNAVYCKWPVIAIIIVGGLIVFSVIWCISRCLCCGLSCCCECCHCLKCCGNCCGCCDPPRGRKHKYLDEPFVPPHHDAAAYKRNEPMYAGPPAPPAPFAAASTSPFSTGRSEHAPLPPQYAEFDVSKKRASAAGGHEDALPVMPTWESAGSKKVLVEEEEVEMDQLKKPEASNGAGSANGQNVPLMTGASAIPGPVSPIPSPDHRSPYSPPGAPGANGGYMGASATDPYTASGRGYNNYNSPGPYGQSQTSLGTDQGYGMAGAAMANTGRSHSPWDHNSNNTGYGQDPHNQHDGYQDAYGKDQGYPAARPAAAGGYNSYNSGRQDSYDSYNQQQTPNQPYGRGPQNRGGGMRSPPRNGPMPPAGTYPQERMGRTPPPRAAEYGMGGARTYSPAPMMPQQQQQQQPAAAYEMLAPAPKPAPLQRQPTYEMPAEPVAPSPVNAGFDFGAGYSRPAQNTTPANEYRSEMPAHNDGGYGGSRPQRHSSSRSSRGGVGCRWL
ncbi:hypothetical protein CONLIGDRAFT_31965 [Coniochaeta ligniaria NRRL 30616]|uniref:Fibroin-3 related protein n=1 Tax=Coniochaeta ligniaria NRRL 30616 TaxID=1408157 RepID=A0A1J7JNG4_9PEZI|nr:hypothetical protein CONLIGDRAFT_31965 [Coniochaeta ligniaria NRRL 30616]